MSILLLKEYLCCMFYNERKMIIGLNLIANTVNISSKPSGTTHYAHLQNAFIHKCE